MPSRTYWSWLGCHRRQPIYSIQYFVYRFAQPFSESMKGLCSLWICCMCSVLLILPTTKHFTGFSHQHFRRAICRAVCIFPFRLHVRSFQSQSVPCISFECNWMKMNGSTTIASDSTKENVCIQPWCIETEKTAFDLLSIFSLPFSFSTSFSWFRFFTGTIKAEFSHICSVRAHSSRPFLYSESFF